MSYFINANVLLYENGIKSLNLTLEKIQTNDSGLTLTECIIIKNKDLASESEQEKVRSDL